MVKRKDRMAPLTAEKPSAPTTDIGAFIELMEGAMRFRRFAAQAKVAAAHDDEVGNAHQIERQAAYRFGRPAVEAYLDAHAPRDPWIDEHPYDPFAHKTEMPS